MDTATHALALMGLFLYTLITLHGYLMLKLARVRERHLVVDTEELCFWEFLGLWCPAQKNKTAAPYLGLLDEEQEIVF